MQVGATDPADAGGNRAFGGRAAPLILFRPDGSSSGGLVH